MLFESPLVLLGLYGFDGAEKWREVCGLESDFLKSHKQAGWKKQYVHNQKRVLLSLEVSLKTPFSSKFL